MAKKITINDQELINKLEAYGFEVNSRAELCNHMIRSGISPSDPSFQAYHKEYQEFFVQNETAKAELEREYVKPLLAENQRVNWSLDYASRELTIEGLD